jgi:hypothetical protein
MVFVFAWSTFAYVKDAPPPDPYSAEGIPYALVQAGTSDCSEKLWQHVRLWGTNVSCATQPGGPPYEAGTDERCRDICVGSLGWTRETASSTCWCIDQPLSKPGSHSTISAALDLGWVTGFNPNAPGFEGCRMFILEGQKIVSHDRIRIPSRRGQRHCIQGCYARGMSLWTYIHDDVEYIDECYCSKHSSISL